MALAYNDVSYLDNVQIVKWINEYKNTQNSNFKKKLIGFVFLAYVPLIKSIVHSFARRSSDPFDDIFQVASLGLINAMELFNPEINGNFRTYAIHTMTGFIRHYLRDKTTIIRAPRQIQELSYRINKLITELTQKLGKPPTDEQLALELQLPDSKVREAMELDRRTTPIPMESLSTSDSGFLLDDFAVKNASEKYKEYLSDFDNYIVLKEAINALDDELKLIIELSFFEDYSQAEIAKRLDISAMSVSRKIKKALNKLFEIITNGRSE